MSYRYNSTIKVKDKICMSCGKKAPHFSKKRCEQCARIENVHQQMERDAERMIKEEDLSSLISEADTIFSRYIRMAAADNTGIASCYTCETKKHFSLLECGHYMKRGNLFLRFDERNCRPQCKMCNHNQSTDGEKLKFTKILESEHPGITDILREEAALVYKPTREELRGIITEYTAKLKVEKKRLNIQK